jgi:hypothetical protein
VGDRAAELRVDLGVDRLRIEQPLHEPRRRAVGHPLELGDVERRPRTERLEHERMAQLRGALVRKARARESPLPPVGARDPLGLVRLVARDRRQRSQAFALGRCLLERARELGQSAPHGCALDLLGREQSLDLLPERARLPRASLVGGRLAHEVQPARRP